MYHARVLEVEKGSFKTLVFSPSGGMGGDVERLVKKLASIYMCGMVSIPISSVSLLGKVL